VSLRVSYDVRPVGYHPLATFHYILETGAGWQGPIGEGTITFRLPYEVNDVNTVLISDEWYEDAQICCNPGNFTVSGTDVTWHFSDLEPTREDNVCLTMMVPSAWDEITSARYEAAANPDSADAHLRLARALVDPLTYMGSVCPGGALVPRGNNYVMAESAARSYERVLELGANDVEVYVEYINLTGAMWCGADSHPPTAPGNMRWALERALELAPNDERLLRIQDDIAEAESVFGRPDVTPEIPSAPIAAPLPDPTSPIATPLPSPVATATPPATVPPPTPTQAADGEGLCPGAMALVLTPLIALVVRKQGRGR
jgi:hypothetical protein